MSMWGCLKHGFTSSKCCERASIAKFGPKPEISVVEAMEVIKQAMIEDDPSAKGSLAHAWHCNIAMMCSDAIHNGAGCMVDFDVHKISNDAASRFMKICFDVETSQ